MLCWCFLYVFINIKSFHVVFILHCILSLSDLFQTILYCVLSRRGCSLHDVWNCSLLGFVVVFAMFCSRCWMFFQSHCLKWNALTLPLLLSYNFYWTGTGVRTNLMRLINAVFDISSSSMRIVIGEISTNPGWLIVYISFYTNHSPFAFSRELWLMGNPCTHAVFQRTDWTYCLSSGCCHGCDSLAQVSAAGQRDVPFLLQCIANLLVP